MTKPRVPTLKPRVQLLPPRVLRKLPPLRPANASGRDADPRRTLPLNGGAWQKLRASVLAGEPLCRLCTAQGLTVPATDVDHRDGDPSNNDLVNLQPLCHECHSRKTAGDHGKTVREGCDVDGLPLGASHPWNTGPVGRVGALPEPSHAREGEITGDPSA